MSVIPLFANNEPLLPGFDDTASDAAKVLRGRINRDIEAHLLRASWLRLLAYRRSAIIERLVYHGTVFLLGAYWIENRKEQQKND